MPEVAVALLKALAAGLAVVVLARYTESRVQGAILGVCSSLVKIEEPAVYKLDLRLVDNVLI